MTNHFFRQLNLTTFFAPTLLGLLCFSVGSTCFAADDAVVVKPEPLKVPNAIAATPQEMKPYTEPLEHTTFKLEMLPIPGGKFMMGSPETEPGRLGEEGPQHEVEVSPFWMSKYEITWNQYEVWSDRVDSLRRAAYGKPSSSRDKVADSITRPTPPYTDMSFGMGRENNPAICMTQHSARMYCTWLSAKTGRYYRLPTEAEWEYACRAGTSSVYSFGDDVSQVGDYAWYADNSDGNYHPVGKKKPNPWGLYDMHGNVAEWVLDQYVPEAYSWSILASFAAAAGMMPRICFAVPSEKGPAKNGNSRILRFLRASGTSPTHWAWVCELFDRSLSRLKKRVLRSGTRLNHFRWMLKRF